MSTPSFVFTQIFGSQRFERLTTVMASIGTSAAYVQALKIYSLQSATAISLPALLIGLASGLCWLLYGLARRIKPLILSNIIGLIGGAIVAIETLIYT